MPGGFRALLSHNSARPDSRKCRNDFDIFGVLERRTLSIGNRYRWNSATPGTSPQFPQTNGQRSSSTLRREQSPRHGEPIGSPNERTRSHLTQKQHERAGNMFADGARRKNKLPVLSAPHARLFSTLPKFVTIWVRSVRSL